MSNFWVWFWRPFGETLGGIAIILGIIAICGLICLIGYLFDKAKAFLFGKQK